MANLFRMTLGNIAWRKPLECDGPSPPKYCIATDPENPGKRLIDKYNNKFLYVVFPIFNRVADPDPAKQNPEFQDETEHQYSNIQIDEGTQEALYKVDLRPFLPKNCNCLVDNPPDHPAYNPYASAAYLNQPVQISGDLRLLLLKAIRRVEESHAETLPPRICTKGNDKVFCSGASGEAPEPTGQYQQHFYLKTVDIGYEVEGLSQLKFKVNNFTITGTTP